jgi:hypothetical protein
VTNTDLSTALPNVWFQVGRKSESLTDPEPYVAKCSAEFRKKRRRGMAKKFLYKKLKVTCKIIILKTSRKISNIEKSKAFVKDSGGSKTICEREKQSEPLCQQKSVGLVQYFYVIQL